MLQTVIKIYFLLGESIQGKMSSVLRFLMPTYFHRLDGQTVNIAFHCEDWCSKICLYSVAYIKVWLW